MAIRRNKKIIKTSHSLNLKLLPLLLILLECFLLAFFLVMLFRLSVWVSVLFFIGTQLLLFATLFTVFQLDKVVLRLDASIEKIWDRIGTKFPSPPLFRGIFTHINVLSDKLANVLDEYTEETNKRNRDALLFRNMQFSALQSQINPHFLYNVLDSIRGEAICIGADNIADVTEALSTYFRYCISRTGNFVTISSELRNIRSYFHIQQYRFGNRFDLHIDVPVVLDVDMFYIPKLTLQPLVENSVIHGLEPKSGSGSVRISLALTNDHIDITVADDGVGIPPEKLAQIKDSFRDHDPFTLKHRGIALGNVNDRLQTIFGEEYGINISSQLGIGTEITLRIPTLTSPPENTFEPPQSYY